MTPLRVTVRSSWNDRAGIKAWCKENGVDYGSVFLVELVDEGQALVRRWVQAVKKKAGVHPVLKCSCGEPECVISIRERVPVRSLPPQACLERIENC